MAFARRVYIIDMVFARSFFVINIYRAGGNRDKFILQARRKASFETYQVYMGSFGGFNISLDRFVCLAADSHVSCCCFDRFLSILARQKARIVFACVWCSFSIRVSIALDNKSDNFVKVK